MHLGYLGARVAAVDFVDENYGFEPEFECFGEDELGLWQGALRSVDEEHDAVDHTQDALHFAAKVCVMGFRGEGGDEVGRAFSR